MSLSSKGSFFVQLPQKKTSFFYIHSLCFLLPCPIPHVIIRPHHSRRSGDGYIFLSRRTKFAPSWGRNIGEDHFSLSHCVGNSVCAIHCILLSFML